MALTTLEQQPVRKDTKEWPPAIMAEFERESRSPNGCVGQRLVSESDRVRVWDIRLQPGERMGFHRHVLDYLTAACEAPLHRKAPPSLLPIPAALEQVLRPAL